MKWNQNQREYAAWIRVSFFSGLILFICHLFIFAIAFSFNDICQLLLFILRITLFAATFVPIRLMPLDVFVY